MLTSILLRNELLCPLILFPIVTLLNESTVYYLLFLLLSYFYTSMFSSRRVRTGRFDITLLTALTDLLDLMSRDDLKHLTRTFVMNLGSDRL
jgi:hypothetical protein